MRQNFENLLNRVNGFPHRLVLGLYFVLVTSLMLWQHSQGWAWDFSVYSLNAEYLFHDGVYMEWKRPPLLSFFLGLLQFIFSVRASEYVFILLNSAFFLLTVFKLSERYDVKPLHLYVLVMSPYVVFYSVLQGTELLFLAFMAMAFVDIRNKRLGLWLALMFLTRYTGGLFGILLIFQEDVREMVYSTVIGGFTVLPWLIFNQVVLDHPFASVADSYALDVVERTLTIPFDPLDVVLMTALSLPLAVLYLKDLEFDRIDIVAFLVSSLIVFRQIGTLMSVRRYLFDLSLPVGFLAAKKVNELDLSNILVLAVVCIYGVGAFSLISGSEALANPVLFKQASEEVGECKTVSNIWPYLSYAGTPAGPIENKWKSQEKYIDKDYKVVIFENGDYTVKGDGCINEPYNSTYIERVNFEKDRRICYYMPLKTCGLESWLKGIT